MSEIAAFLFADLAGFTALTEQHGDEQAADLAVAFCDRVCELNRGHGASDVKTIGDAALIRVPDPAEAICLALCITEQIGPAHGFPLVRVGLDHGPAAHRRGDWFGATINTAARVVTLADAGDVLVTDRARIAAGRSTTPPSVLYINRGVHRLRHVTDPVRLHAVRRSHDDALPAAGGP